MFKANGTVLEIKPTSCEKEGRICKMYRISEGIQLKMLHNKLESHSSMRASSLHSSMKNLVYSFRSGFYSYTSKQSRVKGSKIIDCGNFGDSKVQSLSRIKTWKIGEFRKSKISSRKGYTAYIVTKKKDFYSPQQYDKYKYESSKTNNLEYLLTSHIDRNFTLSLIDFINKYWKQYETALLLDSKIDSFVKIIQQKSNWLTQLTEDFVTLEYPVYTPKYQKIMAEVLLKKSTKTVRDMEAVIKDLVAKMPEETILSQYSLLYSLFVKLIELYDPKVISDQIKTKEKFNTHYDYYVMRRNRLKAEVSPKLKATLNFVIYIEKSLSSYQRYLTRCKQQIGNLYVYKQRLLVLLDKKTTFTPISIDYERVRYLKETTTRYIKQNLEYNVVKFHYDIHKRNDNVIKMLEAECAELRIQMDYKMHEVDSLKSAVDKLSKVGPQRVDAYSQVFLIPAKSTLQMPDKQKSSHLEQFIDGVVSPFSFSEKITGQLISVIMVDKVLADYEAISSRQSVRGFGEYLCEWFIIKTGTKKIAQIFVKNFVYALKELKRRHKRFHLFDRICGIGWIRGRNMQYDLEAVFFTSSLVWYYLLRLCLLYRKKLNDNPNGYQLLPPLDCEEIFKIPLRKIYELAEYFLAGYGITIPKDLSQRIDHYSINEISRYRSHDEEFQKSNLQYIHVLKEISFDIIAGFLIYYIAHYRGKVVEKLLRGIAVKQKLYDYLLGYTDFETTYRKYYQYKKSKVEYIYAQLCLVNQHDTLNVKNMVGVVHAILDDERPLRLSFDKLYAFKVLILPEKLGGKNDRKVNLNSYELFRERYYTEFYDFYSTIGLLYELFRVIKSLVKKYLLKCAPKAVEKLLKEQYIPIYSISKVEKEEYNSSEDDYSSYIATVKELEKANVNAKDTKSESVYDCMYNWLKIIARVPHFPTTILTIDQILVHNIHRKEMIEASEIAWNALRGLLIIIAKE